MKRWDLSGGIWCRMGRWWVGFMAMWPFLFRVPVITGGSEGLPAQGSYLLLEATGSPGSPTTFDEIPEVTNIAGGGGTSERIDFTHLRSPRRRREYKPSFIDDGKLSFNVQLIPSNAVHQRILALQGTGEEVALREVFPDASGWDYRGYIESAVKSGQSVGGKIMLDVVYQISGEINFDGMGSPA